MTPGLGLLDGVDVADSTGKSPLPLCHEHGWASPVGGTALQTGSGQL